MNLLLTREAFEAYQRGDYVTALSIYRELSAMLGESLFRTNIQLTERRLASLPSNETNSISSPNCDVRVSRELRTNNVACISEQTLIKRAPSVRTRPSMLVLPDIPIGDRLTLTDEPVWTEFELDESDYVLITVDIAYEHIPAGNGRKAVAVIEYRDAEGALLPGPYPGFTYSEIVGWYCYVAPSHPGGAKFSLKPPIGSNSVHLGFRAFCTSPPQLVTISPSLALLWHDNSPRKDPRRGHLARQRPTLPVLPFEMPTHRDSKQLTVASILDPFSHACFAPECDLAPITPSRWRDELIDRHVDMILVESAWHGNNDAWLYRIANYASPPGNELTEVLQWARRAGVPTVFWNKEDPPNFERFIDRAREFDYIFTTDENCVERYKGRVPSSTHVGVLPFAAQPQIHNPLIESPRLSATSFAGTYYADDFEPRRRAMDMLLRVATRYGLDIFDRMHDVKGKDKERYTFPTDLQPYIRGSLNYEEMLKAYRRYRVGLNVNSVSDSPTMFSRRVYELLACGTPVVSTESTGIDQMFNGLVPTVESESEAVQVLKALMEDPMHWLRTSVRGVRTVFHEHTYGHRLEKVSKAIGLDIPCRASIAPIVVLQPNGDPVLFADSMRTQRVAPAAIIVVGNRYSDNNARSHIDALSSAGLPAAVLPAENIVTYIRHRYTDSVIALCDSRNYYGPGYLLDAGISLVGTPEFSASTIRPVRDPVQQPVGRGFDSMADLGLPDSELLTATLVTRSENPLLLEVLGIRSNQDVVEIGKPLLRTRAGFDFLSRHSLLAGISVGKFDL